MDFLSWRYILAFIFIHYTGSILAINEVIGKQMGHMFAKVGETATMKWTYRADSLGDIIALYFNKINRITNQRTLIAYQMTSQGNFQLTKNQNYMNRVTVTKNNQDLEVRISDIREIDGHHFELSMLLQSGITYANSTEVIVVVQPSITEKTETGGKFEIYANQDDDVSLECGATIGNPRPLEFTWRKKNIVTNKYEFVTEAKEMYRFHLNLTRVGRPDLATYRCTVRNGHGGEDSYDVSLLVKYRPVVTVPPLNRTVLELIGNTFMDCSVDGNAGKNIYHWYKEKPERWKEINSGVTDKEIIIENEGQRLRFLKPPRTLALMYYCAAENDLGLGGPAGALLNVTYGPGDMKYYPKIVNEVRGIERENITVTCETDANPKAVFTWMKRERRWDTGVFHERKLVEQSFSGKLHLFNLTDNDTAEYTCIAENRPDIMNREIVKRAEIKVPINVYYAPRRTNITVNARNDTVLYIKKGEKARIHCKSDSNPPATYNIQLRREGINLVNGGPGVYNIDSIQIANEGMYDCIAFNSAINKTEIKSIQVVVSVEPERIFVSEKQSLKEGAAKDMMCRFKGKPPPKVVWQFYGANITRNDSVRSTTTVNVRKDGDLTIVESKLKFTQVRYTDDGSYSCYVFNYAGRINNSIVFDVSYTPKITKRPEDFTVQEGDGKSINLACEAKGKPTYIQWRWKKTRLNGITDDLSVLDKNYKIQVPSKEDNGVYTCQPSNSVGLGEIATARVVVEYPPVITVKPVGKVVNVSDYVVLTCDAVGVPIPDFLWTKLNDPSFEVKGKELNLGYVKRKNKGTYSCNVKNKVGSQSAQATIRIQHVPEITSNTPSQTKVGVDVGSTATLSCTVDAYPSAKIQWTKKGDSTVLGTGEYQVQNFLDPDTKLLGRTDLTVTVQPKHQGMYFICTATNSFGSDTQEFQILSKQAPDPPVKGSLKATDEIKATIPVTVDITLTWIPGFNGGEKVDSYLHYRKDGEGSDTILFMKDTTGNKFVLENQKPSTLYMFSMKVKNYLGSSALYMPYTQFETKNPPPDVAKVMIAKDGDEGTAVRISWNITASAATKRRRKRRGIKATMAHLKKFGRLVRRLRRNLVNNWDYALVKYRVVGGDDFIEDKINDVELNGDYVVNNLDADEEYEFQFWLYDNNGKFANPVYAGKIFPGKEPEPGARSGGGLSRNTIIGIAAGCGGFLLIVLVAIALSCVLRRKDKNQMYPTHTNGKHDIPISSMGKSGFSYSSGGGVNGGAGGADVVRQGYIDEEEDEDTFMERDHVDKGPPEYSDFHYNYNDSRDFDDNTLPSTFRPDEPPVPKYTSYGRLPKDSRPGSERQSQQSLASARATEISRRNRRSMDPLDEANQSYGGEDDDLPEPPSFLREAMQRSPSSEDENRRVPGSFGDQLNPRNKRQQKPPYPYENMDPPPPATYLNVGGRQSPTSTQSQASSKPYRSDNEYIDDVDESYVGYLV